MRTLRVLVIEPTRVLGQLALQVVDQVAGSSTLVTSADEALPVLDTHDFDVVCCAAVLRGLGSLDFARVLRARKPTLPLVLLTTGQNESFSHAALAAGVTQVIPRSDLRAWTDYLEIATRRVQESQLSGHALVVEDSKSVAQLIAQVLQETGLQAIIQASAEGALRCFAEQPFAVVVTDIVLSGNSSGIELVRELRRTCGKRGARTPILAITSLDDPARRVELIRSGVSDQMLKPFLPEELVARVSKLLDNQRLLDRVEAQQEELRQMALTDQLTRLPNRHFLVDAAAAALAEARQSLQPVSLIVLDLDRFKAINDTYGHRAGDAVLSELANLLRQGRAARDVVARFGGEEFVVLLPHTGLEVARAAAELLRERVACLVPAGIPITASLGVACCAPAPNTEFDLLFTRADHALYAAKREGRDRVVCAPDEPSTAR